MASHTPDETGGPNEGYEPRGFARESTRPGLEDVMEARAAQSGPAPATREAHVSVGGTDVGLIQRQLRAARLEVASLVEQLNQLQEIRRASLDTRQQLEAARARIVNLESERDQALEEVEELRAASARAGVADAPSDAPESLRATYPAAEARRSGRGTSLERAELIAELGLAQGQLADLRAEMEHVRSRNHELEQRATEPNGASAGLVSKVDELEAQLRAARKMGDTAESELQNVLRQQADTERAHQQTLGELEAARDAVSAAGRERDEAFERAQRKQVALERVRTAFLREQQKVKALQPEEGTAAAGPAVASGELEALRDALRDAQSQLTEAQVQLADGRDELRAARATQQSTAEEVDVLRGSIEALEMERDQLREALVEAQEELSAARSTAPRDAAPEARPAGTGPTMDFDEGFAEADLERVERQLAETREELDAATRRLADAEGRVARAEARAADAELELSARSVPGDSGLEEALEQVERERDELRARSLAVEQEVTTLRSELTELREAGGELQRVGVLDGDELEARVAELEEALEEAALTALKGQQAAARAEDLEAKIRELEARLADAQEELSQRPEEGGADAMTLQGLETEVERLREVAQRGSAQIQQYLLELEGAKGVMARSAAEVDKSASIVRALFEGIGHLDRYLQAAGPGAQRAVTLLQEVRRRSREIQQVVDANERLSRSISKSLDRLGAIVMAGMQGPRR